MATEQDIGRASRLNWTVEQLENARRLFAIANPESGDDDEKADHLAASPTSHQRHTNVTPTSHAPSHQQKTSTTTRGK